MYVFAMSASFTAVWRNVGNVPTDVPRFPERADRLVTHLQALDADIIALSECRDSVLDDGTVVPIVDFHAKVAGTRYAVINQNGVATPSMPGKAFYLTIFVDRAKLVVSTSKMVPLGGSLTAQLTPGTWNRTVHALRLVPVNGNAPGSVVEPVLPFWVLTTHFNIPKPANTAETVWLAANAPLITENEPYVLMGDFNFFPEVGRSEDQEAVMAADHVDTFAASTEWGTGRALTTTFVGFPNDAFRCKDIYDGSAPGRLDRVYTRRDDPRLTVSEPQIDTRLFLVNSTTGEAVPESTDSTTKINRWDFPSDHFPLVMRLTRA